MPSTRKTVPTTASQTDQTINDNSVSADFTYEQLAQLWDKLDNSMGNNKLRQAGDIDSIQVAERYHVTPSNALDKMKKLVREHPDQWQLLKVRDTRGYIVSVIRSLV